MRDKLLPMMLAMSAMSGWMGAFPTQRVYGWQEDAPRKCMLPSCNNMTKKGILLCGSL